MNLVFKTHSIQWSRSFKESMKRRRSFPSFGFVLCNLQFLYSAEEAESKTLRHLAEFLSAIASCSTAAARESKLGVTSRLLRQLTFCETVRFMLLFLSLSLPYSIHYSIPLQECKTGKNTTLKTPQRRKPVFRLSNTQRCIYKRFLQNSL